MQSAAKKILGGCAAFAAVLHSAKGSTPGVDYQVNWLDVMKMPVPLSDATASSVDQSIYIVGGCDSAKGNEMVEVDFHACKEVADHILIYNVAGDTWSMGADMPSARYRHAAAVHGNYVYVAGGRDVQDKVVTSVLQYSTTEDKWTTIADWADASSDNAAFVYGDHMYVCGGWQTNLYTATPKCHVMDLSQSTKSFVTGPALQTARGDHRMGVHDGYAYCVGGFDATFAALNSLEVLDLSATNLSWTAGPPMTSKRGDFGFGVYDGRLLVMGGETGDQGSVDTLEAGASLRKVEAFDPATNTWLAEQDHEPIPHAVFRFCATSHSDRVFVFGGQLPYNSTCQCYPTTDMVFAYRETNLSSTDVANDVTNHAAMQSLWLQRLLFAVVLVVKAFHTE